jgi:selenocysteine-specific elongation factor
MVAGVTGIDLVLLIISADESIKPQTREHFDICRLLGVRQGIVVVTKSDAVDPDIVELVKLEAEEFVAGSFLEGAPILAVSARTGQGLDELKQAIRQQAAAAPTRASRQPLRLPIDRTFAMKGFGTVVTGTLSAGASPNRKWNSSPSSGASASVASRSTANRPRPPTPASAPPSISPASNTPTSPAAWC